VVLRERVFLLSIFQGGWGMGDNNKERTSNLFRNHRGGPEKGVVSRLVENFDLAEIKKENEALKAKLTEVTKERDALLGNASVKTAVILPVATLDPTTVDLSG